MDEICLTDVDVPFPVYLPHSNAIEAAVAPWACPPATRPVFVSSHPRKSRYIFVSRILAGGFAELLKRRISSLFSYRLFFHLHFTCYTIIIFHRTKRDSSFFCLKPEVGARVIY